MGNRGIEAISSVVRRYRGRYHNGAGRVADNLARDNWCLVTKLMVGAAALAFWLLLIPFILSNIIPASNWFEVNRVFFSDSVTGHPPHLTVDRIIHRQFRGSWDAEVKREDGSVFDSHCLRHSPVPFDYKPTARIPPDADLRWWLEIPPNRDCRWEPGRYIVETTWRIYLWLGVTLKVKSVSNVFTIRDAQFSPQFRGARE